MLKITYKSGRGAMQINLESLLPCSKADFRRLLDTVNMSDQIDDHAGTLYRYIAEQTDILKKYRDTLNAGREKKALAKVNAEIKKYLGLADMLTREYNTPEITDADAKITLKAATVYALRMDEHNKPVAREFSGWTFQKSGFTFEVYREGGKHPIYVILLEGTGLKIADAEKRSEIIVSITPHLLDLLNKQPEKITTARDSFRRHMIEAGFIEAEQENENRNENNDKTNNKDQEENTMKKTNTNNYFAGVKTLEELRTVYKNLLKVNHPDNGGAVEIMQEINAQYDQAFKTLKAGANLDNEKERVKWSDAEDAAIREALNKIVHLRGLNIEIVGCWVWVDGETFTNKDILKEAGYQWSRARKKWHFSPYEKKFYKGSKKSFDQLRREYGSATVEKEERASIA